jgi:hypothetical protein
MAQKVGAWRFVRPSYQLSDLSLGYREHIHWTVLSQIYQFEGL